MSVIVVVSVVAQLCPTLCDPIDCSPPGSSVHGILQARILEWVAISFSRGFYSLRDTTCISSTEVLKVYNLYWFKKKILLMVMSNSDLIQKKWPCLTMEKIWFYKWILWKTQIWCSMYLLISLSAAFWLLVTSLHFRKWEISFKTLVWYFL